MYLGQSYLAAGRPKDAARELEAASRLYDDPGILGWLGYAHAASADRRQALEMLQRLSDLGAKRYVSPYAAALVHTGLGNWNEALSCLEQAHRDRSRRLICIKADPNLERLRREPRFQTLLDRMAFPR